jgi:hypothetical protein
VILPTSTPQGARITDVSHCAQLKFLVLTCLFIYSFIWLSLFKTACNKLTDKAGLLYCHYFHFTDKKTWVSPRAAQCLRSCSNWGWWDSKPGSVHPTVSTPHWFCEPLRGAYDRQYFQAYSARSLFPCSVPQFGKSQLWFTARRFYKSKRRIFKVLALFPPSVSHCNKYLT